MNEQRHFLLWPIGQRRKKCLASRPSNALSNHLFYNWVLISGKVVDY
ncbi:hypothetical protein DBT_0603 [Dissulfuribacter thermophilus]|uniref:Uncharacterized protein n=1 Tax=Dissulfuribacter thermophilus TaxID=1156395 RepID=A0A1B9F8N9_9BACT|nr:hypothetical protein DBT_0603 [Dissulfuribacter thermophilus]